MVKILLILIGVLVFLIILAALGVFAIWYAYISGDEFAFERLERAHGLRKEEGHTGRNADGNTNYPGS